MIFYKVFGSGLWQAGDCAVYLWATKGSNLVYKLGVGTRCGGVRFPSWASVNEIWSQPGVPQLSKLLSSFRTPKQIHMKQSEQKYFEKS